MVTTRYFLIFFTYIIFSPVISVAHEKSWAEKILQTLNLEEKIGQLFVIGIPCNPAIEQQQEICQLIQQYHLGGIFIGDMPSIEAQIGFINVAQEVSKIPLLVCQDLEWGLAMRLPEMKFPYAMTLGAIQDNFLLYEMGKELARQARLVGVYFPALPVVDVNTNSHNPIIGVRSFGDDPYLVAQKAWYLMKGLQAGGVLTCAKHFPGHGDTLVDSHLGLPLIEHTREHLNSCELVPFKYLIHTGIDALMTAHILVPMLENDALPATLSQRIIKTLLKTELSFSGLVMTDALDMHAISHHFNPVDAVIKAFLAGNDLIIYPEAIGEAIEQIAHLVRNNATMEQDLNERVLKILSTKERLGLSMWHAMQVPTHEQLYTTNTYALKKDLYTQAITLYNFDQAELDAFIEEPSKALVLLSKDLCIFEQTLKNVSSIPVLASTVVDTKSLENYKKVCVAFKTESRSGFCDSKIYQCITEIIQKCPDVLIILFGNPYALLRLPISSRVIVAYEDDADAQDAASDILLGKRQALGKLPIRMSLKS